jgi:hypothetical protein|tara:strand:- start:11675 stop:11911 length:237 start_codon:yes stop_codon:yes gene_type:complete
MKRTYDSIQWVIDALDNDLVEKRSRENHKTDELRADEDLSWCPKCRRKWNMFENVLWSSPDIKLWKDKICPDCDSPAQ